MNLFSHKRCTIRYSRRFLALAGMIGIVLFTQQSNGGAEKDIFQKMSAEGKSEADVFAYVKSLAPEALLRLGRELSADLTWAQPASGIEYVTSVILSAYADKVGRNAVTSPLVREIGDGTLPEKWRRQVLSWLCGKARKPANDSWFGEVDAEMIARSLLGVVTNVQEKIDVRRDANANLAHLLIGRYESAIKSHPGDNKAIRTIYEDHLKWLTGRAMDPSDESGLNNAAITTLAIYQRLGVPESSEIKGSLLSVFKHREKMADQDKVLLAEVLVESGEGNRIKAEMEDCAQKVTDPALRRKCRKLLNQIQTSESK